MSFKKRMALASALAALAGAGGTAAVAPTPAVAKSCSSGWKHAVISGAHKCLRRGQFCAKGAHSQYHKYGYHCHGTGRLT